MKLKGEVFYTLGVEADFQVTDAIVTPRRISIDWRDGDADAHLDATSRDGLHFQGHYGYPEKDSDFEFELTLFKTKHEYLLFGTWCEHDSGDEGVWVFRLMTGSAKPHTAKTAFKPRRPIVRPAPQSKPTPLPSKRVKQPTAKPQRTISKSVRYGANSSTMKSSAGREMSKTQNGTSVARETPPPSPPPSAYLDHLLSITPDQFAQEDRLKITEKLDVAPLSAVFKVSRNAQAAVIRSLAAEVYAKRYKVVAVPQNTPPAKGPIKKGHSVSSRRMSLRRQP